MKRRAVVTGLATLSAGCLGGLPAAEPRYLGPTEEDPDVVDIRYREFTDEEVSRIRAEAREIPYDDLVADLDGLAGEPIVFGGTVIRITEQPDHFVYQISYAGDATQIQWAFGSWTGTGVEESSRVTCWGEVLGPEIFTQGMGEELTVPAIAIADIELEE